MAYLVLPLWLPQLPCHLPRARGAQQYLWGSALTPPLRCGGRECLTLSAANVFCICARGQEISTSSAKGLIIIYIARSQAVLFFLSLQLIKRYNYL